MLDRSQQLRLMIEDELRRKSNVFVIARRFKTTVRVVEEIGIEAGLLQPRKGVHSSSDLLQYVRPSLRDHVLQIKPVCASWLMTDSIRIARKRYDEGKVDICTGRIRTQMGDWLVLYAIPRQNTDKARRPYFTVRYAS